MSTGAGPVPPPEPSPSRSVPSRPEGLVLAPFRALRYDPAVAGPLERLTSPPYDVIDADGVAALEAAHSNNVVRLILPRDGAGGTARYARAAATLQHWRSGRVLRPDPEPALYVYEQQAAADGHVQRGLLGALELSPPEDGIVLPHENTMSGPVSDRLALYQAVEADLEPIFLLYEGGGAAAAAVAGAAEQPPLVDVDLTGAPLGDGYRHRLWALTDPATLEAVRADLLARRAVIADGHHRYATYLRRQELRHASGAGAGPWDRGLAFLVDGTASGPQVHPIHRVLPQVGPAELAERARQAMRVEVLDGRPLAEGLERLARAGAEGPAFLLASGDAAVLRLLDRPEPSRRDAALPADRSPAWRGLDIAVLHHLLVADLWGLPDTTESVDYRHDVPAALAAAGQGGTAVLVNPTGVDAVTAVAAAGERMPRKSTLFTPKPRTGLVLRDHRDEPAARGQPALDSRRSDSTHTS